MHLRRFGINLIKIKITVNYIWDKIYRSLEDAEDDLRNEMEKQNIASPELISLLG